MALAQTPSGGGQDGHLDLGDAAGPCTDMCPAREEEIWAPSRRTYAGLPAATGSHVLRRPDYFAGITFPLVLLA